MRTGTWAQAGSWWRQLTHLGPPLMGRRVNARLVAPVWLALLGFTLAGRFLDGMLVALGAYIVLFGVGQPVRRRILTFAVSSALLLVAVTCGMLAAGHIGWVLLGYLGLAVLATIADILVPLGPPGPYFFVLMVGGGTLLGPSGLSLGHTLPLLFLGSVAATVFALGDVLIDRYEVQERAVDAAQSAVERLREAVADLGRGASATSPARIIDTDLAAAARVIHQAWMTLLDGGGTGQRARQIEARLRHIHGDYRQLYLATTHHGDETEPAQARGIAEATPTTTTDPRRTALGRTRARYRFRVALRWPSPTLVTAIRVAVGVTVATGTSLVVGDEHPFWVVLVLLLVLSYPGDQEHLTLRAVQRLLGTAVGVVAFAAVMGVTLPPVALVLVICVLLWLVSRFAGRNYLIGSFFITVLALHLVVPLSPQQSAGELALARLADTAIGALVAIAIIWLIGPSLTIPLIRASISRVAASTSAVLADLARGLDIDEESFVEHRRQLQHALLDSGTALTFAGRRTARRAQPYRALEQQCTRVGYTILGEAWRTAPARSARDAHLHSELEEILTPALSGWGPMDVRHASDRLEGLLRSQG